MLPAEKVTFWHISKWTIVYTQTMEKELLIPFQCPIVVTPANESDWLSQNRLILKGLVQQYQQASEEEGQRGEINRLEAKIDLLILLMSEICRHQQPLPPSLCFELGRESIRLPIPIAVGETVMVTLYLDSALPLPVVLRANCIAQTPRDSLLQWQALSDEEDHWLGQLLFREHRKQLREAR